MEEELKSNAIKKVMDQKKWSFFDFEDSSTLKIEKGKINFIFSNNGVGKTTIHNVLTSNNIIGTKFKYESFDPNINAFLEKEDVIRVAKNIGLIKEYENKIEENIKVIKNNVINFLQKNKISPRNKIWQNHIKKFLEQKECFQLLNMVLRKDNKEDIEKFNPDPEAVRKEIDEKFFVNKNNLYSDDDKWKKLENYKKNYSELVEMKENIILSVNKVEKNELKNILTKNNLNYGLLECILKCINDYESSEMSYCYICENINVPDFNSIKKQINEKISKSSSIHKQLLSFNESFKTEISLSECDKQSIIKNINLEFDRYIDFIKSWIYKLSSFFSSEKVEEIKKLKNKIEEFKKEKKLNKIKSDDFNMIKEIFKNTIDDAVDAINLNYEDENDFLLIRKKKINLTESLPFSKGEEKLIKFIMYLVVFISENNDISNTFIAIDEVDELFDELNRINIGYVMNIFLNTYKVNFVVLTNKTTLINDFSYIFEKNKISLTLFCKQLDNKRKFVSTSEKEIKFLGFKRGKSEFKTILERIIKKEKELSENEQALFLIYINWLFRVDQLIDPNSGHNNSIEFLKHDFLFRANTSEKNDVFFEENKKSIWNKIFNENEKDNIKIKYDNFINVFNITYDDFVNITESMCETSEEVNLGYLTKNKYFLVENNIKNLVKVVLIREKLRKKIDDFLEENKGEINAFLKTIKNYHGDYKKDFTNHGNYVLLLTKIIFNSKDDKFLLFKAELKRTIYLLSMLDNFIHVEDNPTIILKGIELNSSLLDNLNRQQKNLNLKKSNIT